VETGCDDERFHRQRDAFDPRRQRAGYFGSGSSWWTTTNWQVVALDTMVAGATSSIDFSWYGCAGAARRARVLHAQRRSDRHREAAGQRVADSGDGASLAASRP
jgi:hypothetical protein